MDLNNNIADRQAANYCYQLSKEDAFTVVHKIIRIRTVKAPSKFDCTQYILANNVNAKKR